MNVTQIVEKYLRENGYDGLFDPNSGDGAGCGCENYDLFPCDGPAHECKPGYKIPCPDGEDCENYPSCRWHIAAEKPKPPEPEGEGKG